MIYCICCSFNSYWCFICLSNGFFTRILILVDEHFFSPSPRTFSLHIFFGTFNFYSFSMHFSIPSSNETSCFAIDYFWEWLYLEFNLSLLWFLLMSSILRFIEIVLPSSDSLLFLSSLFELTKSSFLLRSILETLTTFSRLSFLNTFRLEFLLIVSWAFRLSINLNRLIQYFFISLF